MFARHNLVWLSARGWRAARAQARPEHQAALEQWQSNDWPAIVRRRDAGMLDNDICLGVALPPDPHGGGKTRIALRAQALEVVREVQPLPLKAVLPTLPERWIAELAALADAATGLSMRVYGSLALQALTGMPYLTEDSDIDLLFYPSTVRQLDAGLALLSSHAEQLPLDGELVFPSGQAVAWREWRQAQGGNARVLVKEQDAVHLAPLTALLATLRPA